MLTKVPLHFRSLKLYKRFKTRLLGLQERVRHLVVRSSGVGNVQLLRQSLLPRNQEHPHTATRVLFQTKGAVTSLCCLFIL